MKPSAGGGQNDMGLAFLNLKYLASQLYKATLTSSCLGIFT